MSQHTQWVPVSAEGAEQQPGFRCDGCGQVKWQAEQPDEACELCAEFSPTRETFAPPADQAATSTPFNNQGSELPIAANAADRDPAPSPTIEAEQSSDPERPPRKVPPHTPGMATSRRTRNQEDK